MNAWKDHMTAIRKLCEFEFRGDEYQELTVFIDCNPSFSIYTQMGLASSDYLIVPMMADFSSLEGVKGLLTLLYGEYPTAASKKYAETILTFTKQVSTHSLRMPSIYEFVFNNFTIKSGVAKAFDSIKSELVAFCYNQWQKNPTLFAQPDEMITDEEMWESIYMSSVKDFHTSGKVSASLGIPLHSLPSNSSYTMPDGDTVRVSYKTYAESVENIKDFVRKIS
jgi:hypothetical protein